MYDAQMAPQITRSRSLQIGILLICGAAAGFCVHYLIDIRFLQSQAALGKSAAEPAMIWRVFLYRAVALFAVSLLPPLFLRESRRRDYVWFAAGVAAAYTLLALMPPTNLWPFVAAIGVIVTAGPSLLGGMLVSFMRHRRW